MADNGVLQFGKFRLQSGRLSHYFINTGKYQSAGQITKLGEFYAECMREHNINTNLLAGNTHQEIPIMIAAGMTLFSRYGIDIPYSIDDSVGHDVKIHSIVTLDDIIHAIENSVIGGTEYLSAIKQYKEEYGGEWLFLKFLVQTVCESISRSCSMLMIRDLL